MENSGWIKLHRKLWDNPRMNTPAYLSVWVYLLTHATRGGVQVVFQGKTIVLSPGQLTVGAYQISQKTGVPRGTVERILKTFKNEEQIEEQTSNKCSLVTILNWETYQKSEEQNEEQVRTKQEGKEVKNIYTEREKEIQVLVGQYKKNINKNTVLTEKAKKHINARYQTFTDTQLHYAIIKFFFNTWRMENNADKGLAWFFGSDEQISKFLSLKNDRKAKYINRLNEECDYDDFAFTE